MTALTPAELEELVETFPQGLLLVRRAEGTASLANRAARALLGLAGRGRWRLEAEGGGALALARRLAALDLRTIGAQAPLRLTLGATVLRGRCVVTSAAHLTVIIRPEARRPAARHTAVCARLHLSGPQGRLALRVLDGLPDRAIARQFGISVAAVKMRLARLRERLGAASRAHVARAIQDALDAGDAAEAPAERAVASEAWARPATRVGRAPAVAALDLGACGLGELEAALERVDLGVLALDREGTVVCANHQARRLLGAGRGERGVALPRVAAGAAQRLAARPPVDAPPAPERLRLCSGRTHLRALVWCAGGDLVGMIVERESRRGHDLCGVLCGRYGLHARLARAAILSSRGLTSAAIGRALGVSEAAA
ncbi:MAG TPA: sigma factor-like helix-turn-helix DNA-binding protein, partial [Polyangia bacterium]